MADDIRRCGDLDERLAAYVDGEDSSASRGVIDAHLVKCPPCRAGVEAETAARDLVRGHRDELAAHAPESLRARCAAVGSQLPASGSAPEASSQELTFHP